MTLDERAELVLDTLDKVTSRSIRKSVIVASLKEQDKITRHAAAEEALTVPEHIEYDGLIDKDEAHSRVMNCTGGE